MAKGDKIPRRPGTSGNRFTEKRKEVYLAELRVSGRKIMARLVTNVAKSTVDRHRIKDLDFAEAELHALTTFNMAVHMEIRRRGVEGVARPITVAGKEVTVREYSDRLLLALAKSQMEEYRDSLKVQQTTEHSGTLALEADLRRLTPRGRQLMREIVQSELLPEDDDDDVSEEEAEAE